MFTSIKRAAAILLIATLASITGLSLAGAGPSPAVASGSACPSAVQVPSTAQPGVASSAASAVPASGTPIIKEASPAPRGTRPTPADHPISSSLVNGDVPVLSPGTSSATGTLVNANAPVLSPGTVGYVRLLPADGQFVG
jgi:hypothetical protein